MERPGERSVAEPLWRRLGWFAVLWIGSVSALAIVAQALKWAIRTPM